MVRDDAARPRDADRGRLRLLEDVYFHYRTKVRSYLRARPGGNRPPGAVKDNLGIDIDLVVEKDDTFLGDAAKGKFPMFLLGWGADYPDVTNFLDVHFGNGANSELRAEVRRHHRAARAGRVRVRPDEACRGLHEANNAIRTHVPMVPLVHGGSATAWMADVQGAHSSPIGSEYM